MKALATILGAAAATLIATHASGQAINIDFGTVGSLAPAATFGAAANQPGTWNNVTAAPVIGLVDTAGAATGVSVSTVAAYLSFATNNPGTTGDDEALMDDLSDGVQTFTIAGLAAGAYEIYVYSWAPDIPGQAITNVSVNGGANVLTGQSAVAPPPYLNTGHFSVHNVTLAAAQNLVIALTQGASFVSCNGLQIKPAAASCDGDVDGDGDVDVDDLIAVILGWGGVCPCPADVDGDGDVDVDDLIAVIINWGPC